VSYAAMLGGSDNAPADLFQGGRPDEKFKQWERKKFGGCVSRKPWFASSAAGAFESLYTLHCGGSRGAYLFRFDC